jgi:hypothetical protein
MHHVKNSSFEEWYVYRNNSVLRIRNDRVLTFHFAWICAKGDLCRYDRCKTSACNVNVASLTITCTAGSCSLQSVCACARYIRRWELCSQYEWAYSHMTVNSFRFSDWLNSEVVSVQSGCVDMIMFMTFVKQWIDNRILNLFVLPMHCVSTDFKVYVIFFKRRLPIEMKGCLYICHSTLQ